MDYDLALFALFSQRNGKRFRGNVERPDPAPGSSS
jgi:hypothetical protein